MLTWFYWITSIILITLQFFNHKYLGRGELEKVYPLGMVIYLLYAIIETTLALTNPAQIGILLFNLVNVWAFYNQVKGYRRLKAEKKKMEEERKRKQKIQEAFDMGAYL